MCCLAKAWQFLVTYLANHRTQFTIFLRSSMETKCISRGKNAAPISFKLHRIVPLTTTTYQIFHTFLTYPQFSIITQIILLRMKTLLDFLCVIFEGFSKKAVRIP